MYRTEITLAVLSEAQIPEDTELGEIIEGCNTGPYVGDEIERTEKRLSGKEMADALRAAGSDPSFFMLDDEGKWEAF